MKISALYSPFFLKLLFVLVGGTALAQAESTPEFTDIVPLSELVRKGIITEHQAELIRGGGAIGIEPRVQTKSQVERLTISGWAQFGYVYVGAHDDVLPNPPSTSVFRIQNLVLGVDASIGDGWSGVINANFGNGFSNRNYLDSAYIRKGWDGYGAMYLGYKKARFGLEQYTSSRTIPAVQRSIATNYFTSGYSRIGGGIFPLSTGGLGTTRLGLGSRRIGLSWSGIVPEADGLSYYAEITNGYQDFTAPASTGSPNSLGYSGGIQYEMDSTHGNALADDLDIQIGVNATYQPEGNSLSTVNTFGSFNQSNSITGIDQFIQVYYGNLHVIGEFMGAMVERGKATGTNGPTSITGYNTENAFPYGVNAFVSYLFDDTIEPVFRFAMIDSNGAGINPSVVTAGPEFGGAIPGAAPGTAAPLPSPLGVGFFEQAQSYYIGFNWYIIGNNAKLSAGYERIHFQNRWNGAGFNGADAYEDAVRVRMQLVF